MYYCKFDRVQEFGSQLLQKTTRPLLYRFFATSRTSPQRFKCREIHFFFFEVMVRFIWSPVASTSKDTSDDASEIERGSRRRWLNVAWIKLENITSPVNPSTHQIDFFFCLTKGTQLPLSHVLLSQQDYYCSFCLEYELREVEREKVTKRTSTVNYKWKGEQMNSLTKDARGLTSLLLSYLRINIKTVST